MSTSSLILVLLLISVSQCAIMPQNFGSYTTPADFRIPQFPVINFPEITIPTIPTLTFPTIPTIPTPTFPVIPTPTIPTIPTIPTPTFPVIPTPTIPTIPTPILPTIPVIPVDPCGLKPFCGLAANFKTQAELKTFVDKNCPNYWILPFYRAEANTAVPQATPSASPSARPSAQRDFSGTNNQQVRVDEADILKTDGDFIYSISGNVLSIIKAYPTGQTKIMSTLKLKGNPGSLFIDKNYLSVFGTDYEQVRNPNPRYLQQIDPTIVDDSREPADRSLPRPYPEFFSVPYTWVHIYDITKRDSPKQIKNYTMAGYYSNGRKSEETGFVYLLSNQDCRSSDSAIPWYNFGNGKKNMTLSQIFYYPVPEYSRPTFTNVLAFNLRNPLSREENAISFLTLSSWIIYMSEKFLYMTSTQFSDSVTKTVIHKVYVFRSRLIPMADGSVPGTIEKQFNLDEYNYDLRIATTQFDSKGVSSNNVFCLDFSLKIIGSVRKIAPTETIFSARYVDTRLYLVTFRRIDPFFVIDLSNHRLPRVLGELKISGFSNYLHPYDNRTIIGFGQETNDQGQQIGLKVSLFDVTNVRNPTSVADYVLPLQYSYSTAQWEHKAFLFSKEKNLMVVPANYYNWVNNANGVNSFNGAMVFDIWRNATGASIQLRAIVNHLLKSTDEFWTRAVERSLYIENMLYTKSSCLMRVHNLTRLNRVLNLNLNCEYDTTTNPIAPPASPVFNPPAPLQISGTIPVV